MTNTAGWDDPYFIFLYIFYFFIEDLALFIFACSHSVDHMRGLNEYRHVRPMACITGQDLVDCDIT